MRRISGFFFFTFILAILFTNDLVWAANNSITVYYSEEQGVVNRNIFGNNLLGYDPATYEGWADGYYGFSDYGAGIWDPQNNIPVEEVVNHARDIGIKVIRFPGGCGTHHYDWKKAIGPNRTHFRFGIDEFLRTSRDIGAVPLITVSYFHGDEKDAADLVEYLNAPNDRSNPNGGVDWAAKRAENGRATPYGVRYFEIGNEVYHGDHRAIKSVKAREYATRYLRYYRAMKAVDPKINIGAILVSKEWDDVLLKTITTKVDFGILHMYPTPIFGEALGKFSAESIFNFTLALPELQFQEQLDVTRKNLLKNARKNVPLAVTEFNCGFIQDNPVPYRFSLGGALVNAELLKVLMRTQNNILGACHWNFVNESWGMISNGFKDDPKKLYDPYLKRPNYYVFEFYEKYFGDILLRHDQKGEGANNWGNYVEEFGLTQHENLLVKGYASKVMPYLSVNTSKSRDGKKVYLMVINKHQTKDMEADILIKGFVPDKTAIAHKLSAPLISSTDEDPAHKNIEISTEQIQFKGNSCSFRFKKHSLTAIVIPGKGI